MENPLIYKKLCDIQTDIDVIKKENKNQTQNWNFRSIDDVYNELHVILAKHRVFSVLQEIIAIETTERVTEKGTIARLSTLQAKYRFYAEDGSFLDAYSLGEAADYGDKSIGKCMSYSHKYFFIQVFSIPTKEEKDPDHQAHTFLPQTTQVKTSEVSDAQAKRAFAIALSKGISSESLKAQVKKVCGSDDIKKLTRPQYNTLCERLEAYQQAKEQIIAQNEIDQAVDHMEGQG